MKCSSGLLVKRQVVSAHRVAVAVREVARERAAQHRLVARVHGAVDGVGVGGLVQVAVPADLEARLAGRRQAVVVALLEQDVEDRKALGLEQLGPARAKPAHHLPLGPGERRRASGSSLAAQAPAVTTSAAAR